MNHFINFSNMKMLKGYFQKILMQRKLLLMLSLLAMSGLYALIHFLGRKGDRKEAIPVNHFNMTLPDPIFDEKDEQMTKLDYYKRADADSVRKRAAMQQDPYYKMTQPTQPPGVKSTGRATPTGLITDIGPSQDARADELLKSLDQLKQAMQKPVSPAVQASSGGA